MSENIIKNEKLSRIRSEQPFKVKKLINDGSSTFGGLFLMLLGLIFLGYTAYSSISVYKDYQMKETHQYINAGIKGECKTRKILVDCDVTITHQGKKYEKSFGFFGVGSKNYSVRAVRDLNDPTNVSVDLALEKLPSRVGVLAFLAAVSLGFIYFSLVIFCRKAPRINKIVKTLNATDANVQFALYKFDPIKLSKKNIISYNLDLNDKTQEITFVAMKKSIPFLITLDDVDYALVLQDVQSGYFIVVDEGLYRFVMKKPMRKELEQKLIDFAMHASETSSQTV